MTYTVVINIKLHLVRYNHYASRIDFALMRKSQILNLRSCLIHQSTILIDFEFNFGQFGPHHHPLNWIIPKWYPNPRPRSNMQFDRFASART